jgi:hypothetical protein
MNPVRAVGGILLCICAACPGQTITPSNWYERTSPTTNQLNGVGFGAANSSFVAAGSQTTFLNSSNGADWLATSAGGTPSTLFCATYFNGINFAGGTGPVALRYSTDGINWTNGFSATGQIHAILPSFPTLAIGHSDADNTSFILAFTPYPGFTVTSNALPTTNVLLAIASTILPTGRTLPGAFFVAVGEHGTIITSTNGTNWVLRNSGSTVTLRAAVYHQGRMFVGGDSGIVLTSSDGISWTPAAPTSFDIRGLASSGNAIVAVGKYTSIGKLHVSRDGFTWPGSATEFSEPLNAVAFGQSSFVAVGDGGLIVQSSPVLDSNVNAWTKPTSGYWEESFWSCGRLPAADQGQILFTNSGWKALAIGQNTTVNFSNSLFINSLEIDAPSNSFNQLLLNYAGTNIPLDVLWLHLGTNASVASYYSALVAADFEIDSPALFANESTLSARSMTINSGLTLSNAFASVDTLRISTDATLNQFGGNSVVDDFSLDAGATYTLENGSLDTEHIFLDSDAIDFPLSDGTATFIQNGGDVTADFIFFGTSLSEMGEYDLHGGNLSASVLSFRNGSFSQTGGTNTLAVVRFPTARPTFSQAHYSLAGGLLVSSNLTLGVANYPEAPSPGYFVQSGGVHTNSAMSLFGYLQSPWPGDHRFAAAAGFYTLSGGLLLSGQEDVNGSFTQSGGTNSTPLLNINPGAIYSLGDGQLSTSNSVISGFMQVVYGPNLCNPVLAFTQTGGVHTVANNLTISNFATYDFQAGKVNAQNIQLGPSSQFNCLSGIISNWGTLTILGSAGVFHPGAQSHFLGKLELPAFTNSVCGDSIAMPATLDVSGPGGTVLQFRDSSDANWSAPALQILNWQPWSNNGSSHHVVFGTNSLGLSAAQLSKILFIDPYGWPPGDYPAQILSTGEVVPAPLPILGATRNSSGLILSWPGNYQLLTATNVMGPYLLIPAATSPFTNPFTAREQYFRLVPSGP